MASRKIGLTGPLGSGKSTVAALLRKRGFPVFEADACGKELLLSNPEVQEEVRSILGASVFSNSKPNLDLLRQRIFHSEHDRIALENIIHPRVIIRFEQESRAATEDFIFFESALIPVLRFPVQLEQSIAVLAPLRDRVARVRATKGWSEEICHLVIRSQPTEDQYREIATHVLSNTGDMAALEREVDRVILALEG